MKIGAHYIEGGRCRFTVWAPKPGKVELKVVSPREEVHPMERDGKGYWSVTLDTIPPGALYYFRLDGERDRPDPASCFQPQGVHQPSQAVDHASFAWEDQDWKGIPISGMIMYELHVGTFTPEGTFEAIIPRLDDLKEVGVNALELMPVAQFPGERNWGYDGVHPFAPQNSYGGPEGLKRLVDACHRRGMAVILDVVYNHLGPEGNYLWDFGPYFTDRYKTPWGASVNFDGSYSDEVRNFFMENALHWFRNYHVDALRLDAIHAICDMSARPFLQELGEGVDAFSREEGREFLLIPESALNDARVIRPREGGGFGHHAQWLDDYHHALRTLLTGDRSGYYVDFGRIDHLVKSLKEGFVYSGEYSEYRRHRFGNSSQDRPASQFVVFSQNHDQIGNRMLGERPSTLLSFESLKLAAGAILLSPYVPLLFMGEEYGEEAPFLYFVSHSDPGLIEAVRAGRKEEFSAFGWKDDPPDPQAEETFLKSKLRWEARKTGRHRVVLDFYKRLMEIRRTVPALSNLDKSRLEVWGGEGEKMVFMKRWKDESCCFAIMNFNEADRKVLFPLPGAWERVLDSSEERWGGPGTLLPAMVERESGIDIRGRTFVLFQRQ